MKTEQDYFEVTFSGKGYCRTIFCLGVPRVGEVVCVDDLAGKVVEVIWTITSGKPNGRSVAVDIQGRNEP